MPSWPVNKQFRLTLDLSIVKEAGLNINQICSKAQIGSQIFYRTKATERMPKLDTIAKFIFAAHELGLHIGFDDILKIEEN